MRVNNFFKLIISIIVPFSAGFIGAFFMTPAIRSGWYAELVKPSLTPPNWIFGPVWTILYILMGISLFLIWNRYSMIRANKQVVATWTIGIMVFFVQLFLNAVWSVIFFGPALLTNGSTLPGADSLILFITNDLSNIGLAFVTIIALWIAIISTIVLFYKISKIAAYLLLPYLVWISFSIYLNYTIWILN